jgi:hypothetical protein
MQYAYHGYVPTVQEYLQAENVAAVFMEQKQPLCETSPVELASSNALKKSRGSKSERLDFTRFVTNVDSVIALTEAILFLMLQHFKRRDSLLFVVLLFKAIRSCSSGPGQQDVAERCAAVQPVLSFFRILIVKFLCSR